MSTGTTGYKRLRKPEETRMRIRKHDSDEPSYPMTALLVDSVDANRHLEHQILESIGIQTEPANNAQEAMQLLLTGVNFDVIFVDFDLPMISGPQVLIVSFFFSRSDTRCYIMSTTKMFFIVFYLVRDGYACTGDSKQNNRDVIRL